MARYDRGFRPRGRRRGEVPDRGRSRGREWGYGAGGAYGMGGAYGLDPWQKSQINPSVRRGRRRRPIAGRWRWSGDVPGTVGRYGWEYRGGPPTRPEYPEEWWHAVGPEPRADYDWHYSAGRPERYGWSGETGRD